MGIPLIPQRPAASVIAASGRDPVNTLNGAASVIAASLACERHALAPAPGKGSANPIRNEANEGLAMDNRALTINEFCDRYGICRETAYQQIRTGKLRAVKLGRRTVLLAPDVDAWAASLPELRTAGREQPSA